MITYTFEESISIGGTCITDNPDDILFFDIETTGLSPERSKLYLIGYGFRSGNKTVTELIFNDDGHSEKEMLSHFSEKLSHYKYLVSYNGETFDIPYMRYKLKSYDIKDDALSIQSIDVYKTTRKYKKLLGLDCVKQIDVEMISGFKRSSYISGGELINAYRSYIKSRSEKLLADMLTHNHDDIRGLMSICNFYNLSRLSDTHHLTGIINQADCVEFTCSCPDIPCRIAFQNDYIFFGAHKNIITIRAKKYTGTLKHYFKDYKNYYYLPLEDMAIHKSMAVYVDNEHKQKATKETAYIAKASCFLYSPKGFDGDLFQDTPNSKTAYVELCDSLLSTGDAAANYIYLLIHEIFK